MLTHISWLLKSRKRLPSGVQKCTPFARATGMGSTVPWADHSKIVCFLERATISSPVNAASGSSGAPLQERAGPGPPRERLVVDDDLAAGEDGFGHAGDLAS